MKKIAVKQIREEWSLMAMFETKYLCIIPSLATIYKGHIWPIGISLKWLWFGISIIYVGE